MAGLSAGTILSPNMFNSDMFQLKHDDGTVEPVRIKLDATGKVYVEPYSKTN